MMVQVSFLIGSTSRLHVLSQSVDVSSLTTEESSDRLGKSLSDTVLLGDS